MKKVIVAVLLVAVLGGGIGMGIYLYDRSNTGTRVLTRATVALRASNYPKAAEAAEEYIYQRPGDWRGHNTLGDALLGLGRYEEARKSYQEASRLKPKQVSPILGLANTYSFQAEKSLEAAGGDASSPMEVMKQALDRFISANKVVLEAGDLGDTETLDLRERLGRDYQSVSLAWQVIGEKLADEAKLAEGVRFNFEATAKREESADALAQSAKASVMAIAALLDVVRKDPSRPDAANMLVMLCQQHGDTKSLALARKAIETLENPPALAAMHLAFYDLRSTGVVAEEQRREQLLEFCRKLDKLLKSDPQQLQVRLARAEMAYMLKDYATADRICDAMLKDNKRQGRARLIRACVRMAKGEFAEAERQLSDLRVHYPRWAEAHYAYAVASLATGRKAQGERAMRTVTQLDESHANARAYLAQKLIRQGFFEQALVDAGAYYRAYPSDPVALNLYVMANMGLIRPRHDAAEKALTDAWARYSTSAGLMTVVGEGYQRLGQTGKSQQAFRVAAACKSVTADDRLSVALALRRIGRQPEADKILTDELARESGRARVHYELGQLYSSTGREPQAIDHLRTAIKLAPRKVGYHLALAQLWFDIGDISQCLEVLDAVDKDDAEANLLRLRIKLLRRQRVGSHELLKQISRNRQAGLALAVAALNSGRPQWCVNVCEEALKTNPEDRALRFLLGQAYLTLGEEKKCQRHWSIVIRMAPGQLPVYMSIAGMLAAERAPDEVGDILSKTPGARADMVSLAMGWLYSRRGDSARAAKIYEELVHNEDASPFVRSRAILLHARAMASDGKIDQALTLLDDLIAAASRPAAPMEAKAEILTWAGRKVEALKVMARLGEIVVTDKDGAAMRRVVKLMMGIGRFAEAAGLCDRLIELLPRDARSYLLQAAIHAAAGRQADMVPLLTKATRLQPGNFRAYVLLAGILDELGRPLEALDALQRMSDQGPSGQARAIYERGGMLARWGLSARAIECFDRLGGPDRDSNPALELAMGMELARLGATDRAEKILRKIPRYSSQYVAARLGLATLAGTDADRLVILDDLAEANPQHAGVLERRMRLLLRMGKGSRAVETFRKFTETDKGDPKAMATVHSLAIQALLESGKGSEASELAVELSRETKSPRWKQLGILLSLDKPGAATMLPEIKKAGLYDAFLGLIIAARDNTDQARRWAERIEQIASELASRDRPVAIPASHRLLAVLIGRPEGYGQAEMDKLVIATGFGQDAARELASRDASSPSVRAELAALLKATVAIDLDSVALGRNWAMKVLQARPSCQWAAALIMKTHPNAATLKKVIDALTPEDCVLALRLRGSLFRNEGDHKKAAEFYGRAAKASGGNPYLILAQAQATESAGQLPRALTMYERVWRATKDPQAGNAAAFIVSELHSTDTARLTQALQWAEAAVQAVPGEPTFLDTRGWILLLLGEVDRARPDLRRAAGARPNSAVIHYHVGLVEEKAGDMELAKWHFQAAVSNAEAAGAGLTVSDAKIVKLSKEALSRLGRSGGAGATKPAKQP